MLKRQSIEKLINQENTDSSSRPQLQPSSQQAPSQPLSQQAAQQSSQQLSDQERQKLKLVMEIRAFAQQQLDLPVGKAYASYVDTGKNYVVWNVFAAEEFSVEAKQWCYPIIGCAGYRGYFKQSAAEKYADKMADKSYETHVSGVSAYSTLGWFNDPILNTFLNYSELDLAALLFHELAHRVVYIAGDTEFNESFATAVEIYGVKQWLQYRHSTLSADRSFARHPFDTLPSNTQQDLDSFMQRLEAKSQFVKLVSDTRAQLELLYKNSAQTDIKLLRQEKAKHFQQLKKQIFQFADQYYPETNIKVSATNKNYKQWASSLNNAKLIPINSYYQWVATVTAELDRHLDQQGCQSEIDPVSSYHCQQALKSFYQSVKKLKKLDADDRSKELLKWSGTVEVEGIDAA
jgi:predicted aminopeptidase